MHRKRARIKEMSTGSSRKGEELAALRAKLMHLSQISSKEAKIESEKSRAVAASTRQHQKNGGREISMGGRGERRWK